MSYIHDALKKAQQEKRRVVAQCTDRWSRKSRRDSVAKPRWLAPLLVFGIAVGFSAYSWLSSIDQLSAHKNGSHHRVHRAVVMPPPKQPPSPVNSPSFPKSMVPPSQPTPARKPETQTPGQKTPASVVKGAPNVSSQDRSRQSGSIEAGSIEAGSIEATAPTDLEEPSYDQALAYQKAGNLADAKRLYEALLQESPRMVSALNNLGAIYMQEGNPSRARVFFEKAIRIDPTFVDPFYNLACLHSTLKDVKRSLFYLKKAISLNKEALQWAKTDNDLKNLRGHREYEQILQGA